jgi:hypothetical protein
MNKVQKLCAATVLLFVLTGSAVAGHIGTDAVPPPPPPPDASATTEPGHIGTDRTTDSTETTVETDTLVTEIALSLLRLLAVV